MVKFIRNLFLYWSFMLAFRKMDRLNRHRKNNLYIVASLSGRPFVINRPMYRKWKHRHPELGLADITWEQVYAHRVTREILK